MAVADVALHLEPGRIVGLLGPNGAGKTTTVSIIAGLTRADAGSVTLDGHALTGDTDPAKRGLGLVPQDIALYDELSARDNLFLFGALYQVERSALRRSAAAALELVGLADRAGDRVKTFSGGMKRRLNLAAALLHEPRVLLLDEPTVGVDPQSRNAIFENLELLRERGVAVLYTTHYMEEAERLCDRVMILDHGRVVADDTLRGLYRLVPAHNRLTIELAPAAPGEPGPAAGNGALDALRGVDGVTDVAVRDGLLTVGLRDLTSGAPVVLGWLGAHGHRYLHVVSERADLEAVFLALTGRRLRDP